MKIIVGQTYLTRGGQKVQVTKIDRRHKFPVFGTFFERGYPDKLDWRLDGDYYEDNLESSNDLVSLAPTSWEDV